LLPTETRGPIIQKVRRHPCGLRLLVGARFQVSFTPLVGVLFTFPSRYLCTIGRQRVFRLRGWSPYVQTGFHVPRPTQGSHEALRLRGYHPLWQTFPDPSASLHATTGLLRVRSPLLAESLLMSFPPGTEMFQFPGFASRAYVFSPGSPCGGVSPFGHPRINDRSHLPAAFRSVPRPSSPSGAKASTERPCHTHSHHHRPRAGPNRAMVPLSTTHNLAPTLGQQQLNSHNYTLPRQITHPTRRQVAPIRVPPTTQPGCDPPNPIHRLKEHAQRRP
jgi:hypothetical protein